MKVCGIHFVRYQKKNLRNYDFEEGLNKSALRD